MTVTGKKMAQYFSHYGNGDTTQGGAKTFYIDEFRFHVVLHKILCSKFHMMQKVSVHILKCHSSPSKKAFESSNN